MAADVNIHSVLKNFALVLTQHASQNVRDRFAYKPSPLDSLDLDGPNASQYISIARYFNLLGITSAGEVHIARLYAHREPEAEATHITLENASGFSHRKAKGALLDAFPFVTGQVYGALDGQSTSQIPKRIKTGMAFSFPTADIEQLHNRTLEIANSLHYPQTSQAVYPQDGRSVKLGPPPDLLGAY